MLQDVSEYDSSHMGIVCSLMIVRQQGLALVIRTLVLRVEAPAEIALELVIIGALLIDLAQACVVECLRVVGQDFRVVGEGEALVPLPREFDKGLGQWSDELIVKVEPIIHAVVPNDRLFGFDHRLHDETEAHFVSIELFLGRRLARLLIRLLLFGLRKGRPRELLTSNHVEVKIVDGLIRMLAVI